MSHQVFQVEKNAELLAAVLMNARSDIPLARRKAVLIKREFDKVASEDLAALKEALDKRDLAYAVDKYGDFVVFYKAVEKEFRANHYNLGLS